MLLQVFMLSQIWSYVNADIRHCDNSTSQYSVEGTDVSLCCYLSEAACNETTDNDTLVLRPLNSGTGSTTLGHVRVSTCAARLDITNVTSEFYEYTCLRNNVSLNITYIVTLPRPQTPVIRSIVCSVNKDMTLTFDTGKADNFSTSYVITLIEPRRTYILCNGSILSGETGTCRYTNTDISNTFRTTNSTISIVLARPSMNNIVVSTVVNSSVLLYHYVQPSPAEGLRLLNISATEAVVMWRPSDALRDLIKFLNLYGCSLMYQILLESGRETRQAVFKKYFDNQPRKYQYVVIRLDNLTSFTDYNLTVTGRSCWQSSEARQLPFTTLKSVPTISPKIDDFSYGWLDPTDTSQSSIPKLWVTWEPLAQEEKGDTNVTYDVTINDKQTLTTSRSFFVTPTSETGQMRIQIRAVNSIGQSVNQSVIIIPPYTARVGPGVVVDVDGDTANVFVNISSTEVVDLIAIHWCEGDRTEENLDLCKGYPQSQTKQLVSTNLVDTNTYSIQVTQPPVDQQVEINREMDYYDIENVSELGTNSPQKVNVNITIRPRLLTAEYNQSSNFTQEGEQLTGVYTAQFSETLRFYVSVKSGGLWRGMTSSGCYFNRDKDHIEVVSKLFGQDGTTMFRFQQRCDPTTPVQFRAEYFGVFSATDENCRVNRAKICSTRSRTFNYSLVQLPPDLQYVCLEASNHDNSSKKMVAVTAVDSYTGDVSVDNFNKNYLFIIIGVVAFVIAVVILGFFIRRCFKRRKNFQDFLGYDCDFEGGPSYTDISEAGYSSGTQHFYFMDELSGTGETHLSSTPGSSNAASSPIHCQPGELSATAESHLGSTPGYSNAGACSTIHSQPGELSAIREPHLGSTPGYCNSGACSTTHCQTDELSNTADSRQVEIETSNSTETENCTNTTNGSAGCACACSQSTSDINFYMTVTKTLGLTFDPSTPSTNTDSSQLHEMSVIVDPSTPSTNTDQNTPSTSTDSSQL